MNYVWIGKLLVCFTWLAQNNSQLKRPWELQGGQLLSSVYHQRSEGRSCHRQKLPRRSAGSSGGCPPGNKAPPGRRAPGSGRPPRPAPLRSSCPGSAPAARAGDSFRGSCPRRLLCLRAGLLAGALCYQTQTSHLTEGAEFFRLSTVFPAVA